MNRFDFLKKILISGFCFFCLFLTGCSKSGSAVTDTPLVSEDFPTGENGNPIMQTEHGVYYNASWVKIDDKQSRHSRILNLHYYDKESGKNVFLCNKPECKHDGNEFCTATSLRYTVLGTQLYNGSIYAAVRYVDDSVIEFKLLRISLDGSSLSEVVTYCSQERINIGYTDFIYHPNLISSERVKPETFLLIHRNKVLLPVYLVKNPALEKIPMHGVMLYDLETGKLSSFYEEEISEENFRWVNIKAYGDYLYYFTQEPHKNRLHRYHLTDQQDEILDMNTNLQTAYAVTDDDTVYYTRYGNKVWVYHIAERTTEKIAEPDINIAEINYDGTYFYIRNNIWYDTATEAGEHFDPDFNRLYVCDQNWQCISTMHIPDWNALHGNPVSEGDLISNCTYLHFLGDTIYFVCYDNIYCCDRESLLAHEDPAAFPPLRAVVDSADIPYPLIPSYSRN